MIKRLSGLSEDEDKEMKESPGFSFAFKVCRKSSYSPFDITNKVAALLHIMSRCAVATTDMFLSNHQRCVPSADYCYSLLEMIKSGYASATKFYGSHLKIKKLNLVIAFYNRDPRISLLLYD